MLHLLKKLIILMTVTYLVLSITACSTQELYNMAIDYERGSANLEIKSIKLDFGEMSYLDNNIKSDTTIVLLHGFGGDKDIWNRFSAELDGTTRIIIPDLPGHGESVSSKTLNYSISHQSQMLSIFLNALDIKKVHLIGNSMGGAIAIRYINAHAGRVKTLSLIDSLGIIQSKSDFDTIVEQSGSNPMLNICSEQAFYNLLHLGMHKPPYVPGFFMDLLVSKKCTRADIETIIYNDMRRDSDLSHIIRTITTPAIIIWGQKDRIIHVDNSHLFHSAIKDSQLVIFDDLGHVPLLEDPKKTAEAITHFIDINTH